MAEKENLQMDGSNISKEREPKERNGKPDFNHKGKPKRKSKSSGYTKSKYTNDLDWWNRYPELTKSVTNIAFNWIPGMRLQLTDNISGGPSEDVYIASVMRVGYDPTIGYCETDSDSFNAQMRELYIDMHRKYRGIGSYQKSDLGIALFCITDVFSTLAWAERIYGLLNYYNVHNRNVPYTLMEALHIGTTIPGNLALFRYGLNMRIHRAQQLCLPRGLTMLESRIVMNSAIFKDSKNPRASLFAFDPDVYYTFDATSVNTGSAAISTLLNQSYLGVTPGGNPGFTLVSIFNIIDAQLNALLNDDDVTKICSDLIAAYGPENVTTLIPVPEDYQVIPVYDEERLLQLHNTTLCGEVTGRYLDAVINTAAANVFLSNYHPIVIYQHNNVIKNQLNRSRYGGAYVNIAQYNECDQNSCMLADDCLFDTWKDIPDESDIMCGTRLTAMAEPQVTVDSKQYQRIAAFGTEVVTEITIYSKLGNVYKSCHYGEQVVSPGDFTEEEWCYLNKFDWHPLFYIDDSSQMMVFGDVDNFTKMTTMNLQQIHAVAVLSGAKLPMLGGQQVDTKS